VPSARLPPYQYVIARPVERAKQLLQGRDLSLADVAAHAGFADQSQCSRHFKRLAGVTPRQFRMPARIASRAANPAKKPQRDPLSIPDEQGGSAWSRRWRGASERPRPPGNE
jgi:AraC-like DNA-binding protein